MIISLGECRRCVDWVISLHYLQDNIPIRIDTRLPARRDYDRGVKLFDNQGTGDNLFEQVPSAENPGIEFTLLRTEIRASRAQLSCLFCRLPEIRAQFAEGQTGRPDGCFQADADDGNSIVFTAISIRLFVRGMKAFGQYSPEVSGFNLSRNPKGQFRRLALIA